MLKILYIKNGFVNPSWGLYVDEGRKEAFVCFIHSYIYLYYTQTSVFVLSLCILQSSHLRDTKIENFSYLHTDRVEISCCITAYNVVQGRLFNYRKSQIEGWPIGKISKNKKKKLFSFCHV